MRFENFGAWALAFTSVLLTACAPNIHRVGYTQPTTKAAPTCGVELIENAEVTNAQGSMGTIKLESRNAGIACSRRAALELVKSEACAIGATYVWIYNEEPSSPLLHPCHFLHADFYSSKPEYTQQDKPYMNFEPISNRGIEARIGMRVGGILAGEQNIKWLDPEEDSKSVVAPHISLGWNPMEMLGVFAGYSYWSTTAEKEGYEPLDLWHMDTWEAGVVGIPFTWRYMSSNQRIEIGGGYSKVIFAFQKDFVDIAPILPTSFAKGSGWFGFFRYTFQSQNGLLASAGLRYDNVRPYFPGAESPLDGELLTFQMQLGYHLGL